MADEAITTDPVANPVSAPARQVTIIKLEQLSLTEDIRLREKDDENTIADYASIYAQYIEDLAVAESLVETKVVDFIDKAKAVRPLGELIAFQEGDRYFVVDGRLRFLAAQRAGMKELPCVVYRDRNEAIRAALESNKHGLRLSKGDRVKCVEIAIKALAIASNREIARMLGCSPRTIDLIVAQNQLRETGQKVMGKDGKMYDATKKPKATPKKPKAASGLVKLLNAVKSSKLGDEERVGSFVEVVKTMVNDGIADDNRRQEFLQRLQNEVVGGHN